MFPSHADLALELALQASVLATACQSRAMHLPTCMVALPRVLLPYVCAAPAGLRQCRLCVSSVRLSAV